MTSQGSASLSAQLNKSGERSTKVITQLFDILIKFTGARSSRLLSCVIQLNDSTQLLLSCIVKWFSKQKNVKNWKVLKKLKFNRVREWSLKYFEQIVDLQTGDKLSEEWLYIFILFIKVSKILIQRLEISQVHTHF